MRLKPVEAASIKGNGIFEKFLSDTQSCYAGAVCLPTIVFSRQRQQRHLATATKFIEKIDLRINSSHPYAQVSEI
jgi:hypothetical protein